MLRPKLSQFTVRFTLDGAPVAFEAWSDMTALEVVRGVAGRTAVPSRCESGICGTCETVVDGIARRLCCTAAAGLDGTAVTLNAQELS